jgi:pimeloyl-ACP methyl ester carboxylesterase
MTQIIWSFVFAVLLVTPALGQRTLATREFFYVGGKYVGQPEKEVMAGQMYVEVLRPQHVTQRFPLVFIHGGGLGTLWEGTPDGRPGWTDYFLAQGYVVYVVDQPARGRSAWHTSVNSPLAMGVPLERTEHQNTAPEIFGTWSQAKKHTQWPGDAKNKGLHGDPIFDAFYAATAIPVLTGKGETSRLVQAAGSALLDKIGSAILVTHSQAGPLGWLIADSRPQAVKGIVAVEPTGPPFRNSIVNDGNENEVRPWGLTDIPLTYDPPSKAAADLAPAREPVAEGPNLANCWEQASPPRQLPNLRGIPILIVTTEASYHSVYDHCTARYLTKAGVKNTHMRLEDQGIHGNAHFVMLEKNNREVAAAIQKWISGNVK